jgi:hypothetical protein
MYTATILVGAVGGAIAGSWIAVNPRMIAHIVPNHSAASLGFIENTPSISQIVILAIPRVCVVRRTQSEGIRE